jgi:hypothetical protein
VFDELVCSAPPFTEYFASRAETVSAKPRSSAREAPLETEIVFAAPVVFPERTSF